MSYFYLLVCCMLNAKKVEDQGQVLQAAGQTVEYDLKRENKRKRNRSSSRSSEDGAPVKSPKRLTKRRDQAIGDYQSRPYYHAGIPTTPTASTEETLYMYRNKKYEIDNDSDFIKVQEVVQNDSRYYGDCAECAGVQRYDYEGRSKLTTDRSLPPPLIHVPCEEKYTEAEKENYRQIKDDPKLERSMSCPETKIFHVKYWTSMFENDPVEETANMEEKELQKEIKKEKRSSSCPPEDQFSEMNKSSLFSTNSFPSKINNTNNNLDRPSFYSELSEQSLEKSRHEDDAYSTDFYKNQGVDVSNEEALNKTALDSSSDEDESSVKKLKQERNKSASKKYRDRKKQKQNEIFEREAKLQKQHNDLKSQVREIEHDIAAFETDLAKKINTKEKIKQQVCTVLLRGFETGYSRDDEIEQNIMKRILEKITKDNGQLVKEAFAEIFAGLRRK